MDKPTTLEECDAIIDQHKEAFLAVGEALQIVNANRLYKPKYHSFERYCQERHGFTRKNGYDLIKAFLAVQNLSIIGDNLSIDAAIELGKIEDETERAVIYH